MRHPSVSVLVPALLGLVGLAGPAAAHGASQREARQTSGGELLPEQAAYDVQHYRLTLTVLPEKKAIEGILVMRARVVRPAAAIVLDLDDRLEVRRVASGPRELVYEHAANRITIRDAALCAKAGETFEVAVTYGGVPREAPRPPWDGGFTWAQTADGSPWIATSCQGQGADLWWPCKDHPSDEPETMDLLVTVPRPLVVAANGRLVAVHVSDGDWNTYEWHVSTPINNYGVALNIAPYETISADFQSVAGETFPVTYWVLPENVEKGKELFQEILADLRFFEDVFGPYPFRADKLGVAETPHLGMEHQTIIAYGNEYKGNPWGEQRGFDFLLHHEMAHEWWANLVTCPDWNDMWIHEGFGTYAQALYVERLHGAEAYREQMDANRKGLLNRGPVAPRRSMDSNEIYFGRGKDSPGGDIYAKGACILHTLRWVLGDDEFFTAVRRMAYPDEAAERAVDGSACRFATTDDFLAITEKVSGRDLDWFFEVYLRQPELPSLEVTERDGALHLEWRAPGERAFPMPVPVRVGDELVRVPMTGGRGTVALPAGASFEVDPQRWVLRS